MTFYVESFISTLESKIPRLLENEHIFEMIMRAKIKKTLKNYWKKRYRLRIILKNVSKFDLIPKLESFWHRLTNLMHNFEYHISYFST